MVYALTFTKRVQRSTGHRRGESTEDCILISQTSLSLSPLVLNIDCHANDRIRLLRCRNFTPACSNRMMRRVPLSTINFPTISSGSVRNDRRQVDRRRGEFDPINHHTRRSSRISSAMLRFERLFSPRTPTITLRCVRVSLLARVRKVFVRIDRYSRSVHRPVGVVSAASSLFQGRTVFQPSGARCTNQRIRQRQWFDHLEVVHREKSTPTLHTSSPIGKGMFLCEYVGEIVSRDSSPPPSHSLVLTEHLLLDASRMGNLARFTRPSSSSGNCFFEQWWVDGLPRMCLFTSRAVKAGEELTYNSSSPRQSRLSGRKTEKPAKMEELTEEEKSIVRETSVFLQRNLRRIRGRRAGKQRDKQEQPQQLVEGPSLLFLAQNYYHRDGEKAGQHTGTLTHRGKRSTCSLFELLFFVLDLFDLFYVHLRRSHFAQSGRCSSELIDPSCSYAQLAQLTYILNELFEAILNYKCYKSDVYPSSALKKCPLKRLFPMYYELIRKPMDLTIIRQKLDAGEYLSYQSFEDDLLLLFSNATVCSLNLLFDRDEHFSSSRVTVAKTRMSVGQ